MITHQNKGKIIWIIILLIISSTSFSKAQRALKDSSINIPYFSISYQFQMPGGDLAKRFGNNSSVGLSFLNKTKNKWLYGCDWNYLFGNVIKDTGLFSKIG
ncbi:MAG: hypothetical protein IT239_00800, partial [Bacteroidia bacterium]|nr:hypothetical protein [Bacteroidia bacterium]